MAKPYKIYYFGQRTKEWFEVRRGMISGTSFGRAIGSSTVQETLIDETIADVISDKEWNNTKTASMIWGVNEEDGTIYEYEQRTGVNVEEVGFIKNTKYEKLGLSPDGIIKDKDGNIIKAVEIKNPDSKKMIRYWRDETVARKEYEPQLLDYFFTIPTLQEVDFILRDRRIVIGNYKIKTYTIKRSEIQDKLDEAEKKYSEFEKKLIIELEKFIGFN